MRRENEKLELIVPRNPDELPPRLLLQEMIDDARGAHEEAAILRHMVRMASDFGDLKLQAAYMRARADRAVKIADEIIKRIDAGEMIASDPPVR